MHVKFGIYLILLTPIEICGSQGQSWRRLGPQSVNGSKEVQQHRQHESSVQQAWEHDAAHEDINVWT